ncbi:MAG TPA: Spy/CpxP family protein refolding chaperone [Bryobacteraceae bacterium]|jgi:Spy/CpxP family protein refolding chaperone|nr:Spy/CpxP family protein refolding chaperone [Bryobacteraceae bacterium]
MNFRLVSISLAAAALFAQGPGGFREHGMSGPAKTTAVQSYLNLTDAQVSALQQLRQAEAAALKPIYQQSGPLRQSLRTQEQSSSADAAEVGKLVLSIRSLEQQAAPIRTSYQQQALAVLTAAQKTQLAALQSAAALMPAIHEASALNLLAPPAGPEGSGGPGTEMMPHGRFGGPR